MNIRKFFICIFISLIFLGTFAEFSFSQSQKSNQPEIGNLENFQGVESEQTNYPPLEVRVVETKGNPKMLDPADSQWKTVQEESVIPKESRIVTLKNETVKLEIPGVSLIEIDTGSELILSNLFRDVSREVDQSGLLMKVNKEVVNNVEIKTLHGEIDNSLRDHEEMKSNYRLNTPHAVAGVRGTSFTCKTSEGTTECSVLEGEINFSRLDEPSVSKLLGAGLSVQYQSGEDEPDTVDKISKSQKKDLQETREEAKKALLLEPSVSNFKISGNEFEPLDNDRYRSSVDYYRPRKLRISGKARAREDNTELAKVISYVNGETEPAEGLNDWSVNIKPDTVQPGQEREIETKITALDDTGTRSYPRTLLVSLSHPDPSNILPEDYQEGPVNVELLKAGSRSLKKIDFPYHLYRNDKKSSTDNTITLSGKASGKASVQGVAYSMNRGISWNKAKGNKNWSFDVSFPVEASRTFTPWVIGWTDNEIIGSPKPTGEIVYHDRSFEAHIKKVLQNFLESFSLQNTNELMELLGDEFQYENESGSLTWNKNRFETFLSNVMAKAENIQIFHRIKSVNIDKEQARVTFDIEIQGQHRPSGSLFKLVGAPMTLKLSRNSSGKFDITHISGLRHRLYLFNDQPIRASSGNAIQLDRHQIVEQSNADALVQKKTVFGQTSWVLRIGENINEGGIFRLQTNNIGEVFPIPERSSRLYQSAVSLEPGQLYALNFLNDSGESTIGLIRVDEVRDDKLLLDLMSSLPLP